MTQIETNSTKFNREFQVFAKPVGARCNLACQYCYYLKNKDLYPSSASVRMSDDVLEKYIIQHIQAWTEPVINFSWHGGEPMLAGVRYYGKIVELQKKYQPADRRIANSIQTNGTLLNEEWCQFFSAHDFSVGMSMDGPQDLHDIYRVTRQGRATFAQVMQGYDLLHQHNIPCEILCVVNARNVLHPLRIYRFFKQIGVRYVSFLPLVERSSESASVVSDRTVPSEEFGVFLCTIFDEWRQQDIGRIKIQIFEEAARTAFDQEHTLCIFRRTCGGVPVVEHNGDFFSCDHFVDAEHFIGNIDTTPLADLLEDQRQRAFGDAKLTTLPNCCRMCEVRDMCNGGCLKNRFALAADGRPGLEYLCIGYRRFFNHCRPFVNEIARLWRQQNPQAQTPAIMRSPGPDRIPPKTGRNELCPCGSGKKYKNCCLAK